jgi:uncharacterized protein (DUF983 family)
VSPGRPSGNGSPLANAFAGNCPHCGAHGLFDGWVRFAHRCRRCSLDFDSFNVGDGPAAFLILIVGTITVVGALVLDAAGAPPWWLHLIWIPVAAVLTILGLRFAKAWLLAHEYKHGAHEGRTVE